MSLLSDLTVPCRRMVVQNTADGAGGFSAEWTEGEEFSAAIAIERTGEAACARGEQPQNRYTVLTAPEAALHYHDVFKRLTDGKIFRVTSESAQRCTPESAGLRAAWMTAEDWRLI